MAIDRKKIWAELAAIEANGKAPKVSKTPEHIDIKPFYDADDVPKSSIDKSAIDESIFLEGGYKSTMGQE